VLLCCSKTEHNILVCYHAPWLLQLDLQSELLLQATTTLDYQESLMMHKIGSGSDVTSQLCIIKPLLAEVIIAPFFAFMEYHELLAACPDHVYFMIHLFHAMPCIAHGSVTENHWFRTIS